MQVYVSMWMLESIVAISYNNIEELKHWQRSKTQYNSRELFYPYHTYTRKCIWHLLSLYILRISLSSPKDPKSLYWQGQDQATFFYTISHTKNETNREKKTNRKIFNLFYFVPVCIRVYPEKRPLLF